MYRYRILYLGTIVTTKPAAEGQKEEREIQYKTYAQVKNTTQIINKAIVDLNLAPEIEEVPGLKLRFIGIFSKNRSEWLEVDLTTIFNGYCLIPM